MYQAFSHFIEMRHKNLQTPFVGMGYYTSLLLSGVRIIQMCVTGFILLTPKKLSLAQALRICG